MSLSLFQKNKYYYHSRAGLIISFLKVKDKTILDIGCANQSIYFYCKENCKKYLGIDILEFENKEHFIYADYLSLSLPQTFDLVFLIGVLNHVKEEDQIIFLNKARSNTSQQLIYTYANPANLINYFISIIRKKNLIITGVNKKASIYLFKLPYFQKVWNFNAWPLREYLATEFVIIEEVNPILKTS